MKIIFDRYVTTLLNSNQPFGWSFPANPSGEERGRAGERSVMKEEWGGEITSIIGMKENCYRETANAIGKKIIANLLSSLF